ncbi:uncharacterized protein LOC120342131 [Styela clava]
MSSVVEIDQGIGSGHMQLACNNGCSRDDVFSGTQDNDQVSDLSNKFEQLQAADQSHQALTNLWNSWSHTPNYVNAVQPKYDIIRQPNQCMFVEGVSTIHTGINDFPEKNNIIKTNITTLYACRTASDTLIEGIRTSVQQLLSNVPRVVINGPSENSLVPASSDYIHNDSSQEGTKIWFGSHGVYSGGKYTERHRSKTYYRPYCLISRRHYSCQPLSIRRRRYGVSQKGNSEQGVDELTQLLSKMGTADSNQRKLVNFNKKGKLQYSPPPKYYMLRYRPCMKLTKIKERSRSLNDLSFQNLQIQGAEPGKVQNLEQEGSNDAKPTCPPNDQPSVLSSVNITKGGASGSQICQMVSGIGKLSMLD